MVICSSSLADMIISEAVEGFDFNPESSELSDPTQGDFTFIVPQLSAAGGEDMDDFAM